MDAGRIEGLAIPFCAGVFTAFLFGASSHLPLTASALCVALATSCIICLLRHNIHPLQLALTYFAAGFLCFTAAQAGEVIDEAGTAPLSASIDRLSEAFRNSIEEIPYKSTECTALAKALLSGDRSSLSADTVAVFRKSGASHLLALSGMHLGIVYSIMLMLFAAAGNRPTVRRWRSFVIMIVATLYTLVCGASSSLTRALLFIILNELHKVYGRKQSAVRVLAVAMMAQLAISPLTIGSLSFQLSYLAMCGITFVYPKMKAWYPEDMGNATLGRFDLTRGIWNLASLSISCQLFTAPLAWIRFGTFPVYFLMTNLIAAPLTGIIMSLSLCCLVLSAVGACPEFLVLWSEKTLSALIEALSIISEL